MLVFLLLAPINRPLNITFLKVKKVLFSNIFVSLFARPVRFVDFVISDLHLDVKIWVSDHLPGGPLPYMWPLSPSGHPPKGPFIGPTGGIKGHIYVCTRVLHIQSHGGGCLRGGVCAVYGYTHSYTHSAVCIYVHP